MTKEETPSVCGRLEGERLVGFVVVGGNEGKKGGGRKEQSRKGREGGRYG